jgi:hypothetical protein
MRLKSQLWCLGMNNNLCQMGYTSTAPFAANFLLSLRCFASNTAPLVRRSSPPSGMSLPPSLHTTHLLLLHHASNGLESRLIVYTSQLKHAVEMTVEKLSCTSMMLRHVIIPNQLVGHRSNPHLKGSPCLLRGNPHLKGNPREELVPKRRQSPEVRGHKRVTKRRLPRGHQHVVSQDLYGRKAVM